MAVTSITIEILRKQTYKNIQICPYKKLVLRFKLPDTH